MEVHHHAHTVKTIYVEYIRDNISERAIAEETLELVTGEYNIK